MKGFIKNIFRRLGYDLIKSGIFELKLKEDGIHNDLNILSIAIGAVYPPPSQPFVIQVGACDGITNDPVFELLTKRNLPAILVEPVPESYERLSHNYANFKNVITVQAALAEIDAKRVLYRVSEKADFFGVTNSGGWGSQLASFNIKHLLNHGVKENEIEEIVVDCFTLETLMQKFCISRCDVLQVDTEGLDDQIVMMALKLEVKPRIIHFEHQHLPVVSRKEVFKALRCSGYSLASIGYDTLAVM